MTGGGDAAESAGWYQRAVTLETPVPRTGRADIPDHQGPPLMPVSLAFGNLSIKYTITELPTLYLEYHFRGERASPMSL